MDLTERSATNGKAVSLSALFRFMTGTAVLAWLYRMLGIPGLIAGGVGWFVIAICFAYSLSNRVQFCKLIAAALLAFAFLPGPDPIHKPEQVWRVCLLFGAGSWFIISAYRKGHWTIRIMSLFPALPYLIFFGLLAEDTLKQLPQVLDYWLGD